MVSELVLDLVIIIYKRKDNMRLVWWIDLWMFHFLLNKDTFFRLSHFMILMTGRKAYISL